MWIYGINPIAEALRSPRRPVRLVFQAGKDSPRLQHLRRQAGVAGIPVEEAPRLDTLVSADAVHQGVAAEFAGPWELPLADLPADVDRLVVFDGLNDPHNFGAALRVCEVFGFPHVLYHHGNSSGLTPAAVKVSSGAVFHLALYVDNLNRALHTLKERGFAVWVLEGSGAASLYDLPLPPRLCLVIGSEEHGVRFNIRRQADALVRIPTRGKVESLNVSCALSAALAELARRRGG